MRSLLELSASTIIAVTIALDSTRERALNFDTDPIIPNQLARRCRAA